MIQWAECVRFKRGERKREGGKKRGGRCEDASQSMCLCVVSLNALKDAGEKVHFCSGSLPPARSCSTFSSHVFKKFKHFGHITSRD